MIGSGLGGLTTAALLAKHAGKRVLVLERHYTPGGFTHVFKRPGYEWDVGLHYVGEMDVRSGLSMLFDDVTGGAVQWARMPDCYDRVIIGDRAFDLVRGREAFVETLARSFPSERASIAEYLSLILAAGKTGLPFFVERALPRSLSALIGPAMRRPFLRFAARTVDDVLRPVLRDPLLFDVLTAQLGDYGLLPREASFAIHALAGAHFVDGAFYPVGGPSTIADGAIGVIEQNGGALFTNAKVARIVLEEGRACGVEMEDGARIDAPAIVSDAGVPATYFDLLPRSIAEESGLATRLRNVGPSTAHLCLHLGFTKSASELGLDGTNLWIYAPGDREEAFARFANDPEAPIPLAYVSFPSAKDPQFEERHPGRATVEIITLTRMDWFERWQRTRWMKRGDAYEELKERMTERLLEMLFRERPQLRPHLDHAELSTPLSTRHFTGHAQGEIYGLAHTPARFLLPLRAETDIEGLYLSGADLASCGIAGAALGGMISAASILRRDLRSLLRTSVFVRKPQDERRAA